MEVKSTPVSSSFANIIPQITIREVCKVLDIELPNENNTDSLDLIDIDKPVTVCTASWSMKENAIVFLRKGGLDVYGAVNGHASMIIGEFAYRNTDAYSVKLPKGMTAKKAYAKVCSYIRGKYDIPSIAITGNAGKTTTKDLISSVMSRQKNTLYVRKNYNTAYTTGELIQNLNKDHELYIQEVHEPHAEFCSEMVKPNVVVLTNLERGHLDETGVTVDNSIKATLKILDYMKPDGTLFINYDCPYLSKEQFGNRNVIKYSAKNKDCDYWAEDIQNDGESTTFKICSKNDSPIAATIHIAGIHNVNNAVGAYAVGRFFNVSQQDIVEAIATYKPDGIRQNLMKINDRDVLVDCYSTTVLSSVAASKTLCELPLKENGKRVLVISYLPSLGRESESAHRDVGRQIAQLPIDLIVGYRNDAKYIIEECKKAGKNAVFFQYHKDAISYLSEALTDNDNIVFKGGTAAHLEQIANAVLNLNIVPENRMEADRAANGGDW